MVRPTDDAAGTLQACNDKPWGPGSMARSSHPAGPSGLGFRPLRRCGERPRTVRDVRSAAFPRAGSSSPSGASAGVSATRAATCCSSVVAPSAERVSCAEAGAPGSCLAAPGVCMRDTQCVKKQTRHVPAVRQEPRQAGQAQPCGAAWGLHVCVSRQECCKRSAGARGAPAAAPGRARGTPRRAPGARLRKRTRLLGPHP